jgi:hypothetical protein
MIQEGQTVTLIADLFPGDDPDELKWNSRVVIVKELVSPNIFAEKSIWRVEPEYPDDEEDYIFVHAYELRPITDDA